MRYSGGLLGGSWLTAFTSDMGAGKFDGSWLMLQLRSFNLLFLVASVAPLALIGVVLALLLSNSPLGFVAILGIVALVGILIPIL